MNSTEPNHSLQTISRPDLKRWPKYMKKLFLFILLGIQSAWAANPKETIIQFRNAIQNQDAETAFLHLATFEKIPEATSAHFKQSMTRFVEMAKKGWDFDIIEERTEDGCAVVIVNESKKEGKASFDIDPFYLVLQNDTWKILPKITSWSIIETTAPEKTESFKKLSEWFKQRKADLRKQRAEANQALQTTSRTVLLKHT